MKSFKFQTKSVNGYLRSKARNRQPLANASQTTGTMAAALLLGQMAHNKEIRDAKNNGTLQVGKGPLSNFGPAQAIELAKDLRPVLAALGVSISVKQFVHKDDKNERVTVLVLEKK